MSNKTVKLGRNDVCNCGSGKKFKKCCFIKNDDTLPIPQSENIILNNEMYQQIENDLRTKYINKFGEIATEKKKIFISQIENIKRYAENIAFWLTEATIKDYTDNTRNTTKFVICSHNASSLVERSDKMGFLLGMMTELRDIYDGVLFFNERAVKLLKKYNIDVDFANTSLVVN